MHDANVVDRAIFAHLHAALDFFYSSEWSGVHPSSQLGKLHILWKPEYTMIEKRIQASMIHTQVMKLPPAEAAFIECKYRYGPGRFSKMNVIIRYALPAVASGVVPVRLVRELIYRYFGIGLTYERIAKIVHVDARAVDRVHKKLIPVLSGLCTRAEGQLEESFKRGGLIP